MKICKHNDGLGHCRISDNDYCVEGPCTHEELIEYEPVKHARWVLEPHSFYMDTWDESVELAVYITANCSECGEKHPNRYEVYSTKAYPPEDADDDFRFDKKYQEAKAVEKFKQESYKFAFYCPNCGAKMDGDAE